MSAAQHTILSNVSFLIAMVVSRLMLSLTSDKNNKNMNKVL